MEGGQMDFKPFEGKADAGAEMVVAHPGTGMPTDATITLAGTDSKVWRETVRKFNQQNLRDTHDSANVWGDAFDKLDQNKAELLASVTLSWRNVELNGAPLECTRENARKLYDEYYWLFRQVNQFVADRANFFRSVDAPAPTGD